MADSQFCLPSLYARPLASAFAARRHHLRVPLRAGHREESLLAALDNIAALLDIAFFASLKTEEDKPVRFILSVGGGTFADYELATPVTLTPASLAKLSAMSAIGQSPDTAILCRIGSDNEWQAWAIESEPRRDHGHFWTDDSDDFAMTITSTSPGTLEIEAGRQTLMRYHDGSGSVEGTAAVDAKHIVTFIESHVPRAGVGIPFPVLPYASRAMSEQRRGGTILVLPSDTCDGISFRYPIRSLSDGPLECRSARYNEIASGDHSSISGTGPVETTQTALYERIIDEARLLGRMTGVDGLVAIQRSGALLGFGGKVSTTTDHGALRVHFIDAQSGRDGAETLGAVFAGMRHTAAAIACHKNGPGTLAIVLSQDGLFTLIGHGEIGLSAIRGLVGIPNPVYWKNGVRAYDAR